MLNYEIKVAEKPTIRLETKKNSMSLPPESVLCIEQPRHVEFAYDRERQILVMQGADAATRYSVKLPPLSKTDRYRPSQLYVPELVRALACQLDWERNKCYEVEGTYDKESRVAFFKLSDAKISGGWENAF